MAPSTCQLTKTTLVLFLCLSFVQAYHTLRDRVPQRKSLIDLLSYLKKWRDYDDYLYFDDGFFQPEIYDYATSDKDVKETATDADGGYYDLSYLSFEEQEHLKSAGSIAEVAEITGIPLEPDGDLRIKASPPERKPTFRSLRLDSTLRSMSEDLRMNRDRRGHNDEVEMAKRAVCEPEKVSVTMPAKEGFRVVPSCVRLKKCGGCCNPGMVCVATKVKKRPMKVLELALNNTLSRYRTLEDLTEELACGCQCGVREEHCLDTQYYDPGNCACFCKPELKEVRSECEASGRHWDTYRCKCQCPLHGPDSDENCGSAQVFNPKTCQCENE